MFPINSIIKQKILNTINEEYSLFSTELILFFAKYIIANIIGFTVSVFNAYYWNNRFVFKAKEGERRIWWKILGKTFMYYAGTGVILSNILLVVCIDLIGISEVIAPIIILLITIPLNYIMNKYWAFAKGHN